MTVGDDTREVNAGSIVVIPANTPHRFVNSGDGVLRQIGIHASPKFVQTNYDTVGSRAVALGERGSLGRLS